MKICSVCNKENNNVCGNFCIFCGGKLVEKIEEKKVRQKIEDKKNIKQSIKNNTALYIIIVILLIVLIGIVTYTISLKKAHNDEIEKLNVKISTQEKRINELKYDANMADIMETLYKDKAKFLDNNIVFVLDGYGNYYYTYDQMKQVTQGVKYSYWAYNKEAAISRGYRAWK